MEQFKIKRIGEEYHLNIGDSLFLQNWIGGSYNITYAGKPSETSFSFIADEMDLIVSRMHGNLFFPITTKKIKLADTTLEVLCVNEESIKLKYIK
jgi:hypothetical protein